MKKISIEKEAYKIANEILKKNEYTISFHELIHSIIDKNYINNVTEITFLITKILSNQIEIKNIDPFNYIFYKKS